MRRYFHASCLTEKNDSDFLTAARPSSTRPSQSSAPTLYASSSMFYIQKVPDNDGWGKAYEYRYAGSPLAEKVMGIASGGRDGVIKGGSYTMGPFTTTDYGQDIVWADGFFVRYPAGAAVK